MIFYVFDTQKLVAWNERSVRYVVRSSMRELVGLRRFAQTLKATWLALSSTLPAEYAVHTNRVAITLPSSSSLDRRLEQLRI
jgi:hypothetical protein